ncbi:hypothetical protein, partial [Cobetia sp. MC34]|uniref:hypothetical protein n=1 Tax=Cobetia sp. MC34 TaxID=2785080 RepID=UPI001BC9999A
HGTVVRFTGTTRTVLSSIGQAPAAEVSGQEKCQSVLTDWHYADWRVFSIKGNDQASRASAIWD